MVNPDTPTFLDAQEAFEAADIETALVICEGLIGEDERKAEPEVLWLAAECLLEMQEPVEAAHLLDVALASAPDEPRLLYSRGVALFEQARFSEARPLIERAGELDAELAEARMYLGFIDERSGDIEGATQRFTEGVDLDPEHLVMPREWTSQEIAEAFDEIVDEIPDPLGVWLAGLEMKIEALPSDELLRSGDGPISPLVLCLFEGTPEGPPTGEDPEGWLGAHPAAFRVFSRNLGKGAQDVYELHQELLEGLLWEVMEFCGLDDGHLAALGLPMEPEEEDLHPGSDA